MKLRGAILLTLVLFFIFAFPAIVEAHWTVWGPAYVRLLLAACRQVAPSQRIVQFGTQLYSSSVEVTVLPQCTGLEMLRTYSILFGVVMVLCWRRSQRPLMLMLYLGGLVTLWTANFCRNVVMGIGRYAPQGWTSAVVFAVFVFAAYPALMPRRAMSPENRGAAR